MTAPITAWRYWRIESDGYDFTTKRWDWSLRGDFETWEGPLKEAGTHGTHDHVYTSWINLRVHDSPLLGCLCGVNAVKRLRSEDLMARATGKIIINGLPRWALPKATVAFAQVDLGGKVDEYEEGYRARQALISGPIYVVNPPSGPEWREAIERRYGQPVIVQEYEEAIDWIRKDEEANGYREAHQDARAGAPGGTGYWTLTAGGVTRAGGTVPLTNSTSGTVAALNAGTSITDHIARAAFDLSKRADAREREAARLERRDELVAMAVLAVIVLLSMAGGFIAGVSI